MDGAIYELGLILTAGLFGAPHCIGMCGGVMSTWTLQAQTPVWQTVLAYNAGRILTYTIVGGAMGFIGSFVEAAGGLVGLQGAANIAGGLMILLWVWAKIGLPFHRITPTRWQVVQDWLARLRANTASVGAIFTSGLLLGFLPCGLTYAMHMKAAAAGNVWQGMLTLAAFGVGTIPALLLVAYGSLVVRKAIRQKGMIIANGLAVVVGVIAICRGMAINGWIPSINPWLW